MDFPLTASLFLPIDDASELSPDQVEVRLRERIPGVVIDREAGNRHVAEGLQRLIEGGTPEVICRGHRSLFGRMLYVEFPVENHPGTKLHGYTFGFSHYDGCIGLGCRPFMMDALKDGSLLFAERLGLALTLGFGDIEEINLELWPQVLSVEQVLARQSPVGTPDEYAILAVTDWSSEITAACWRWLERHPEPRIRDGWVEKRGAPSVGVPRLIERLRSIGEIQGCSTASRIGGYRDCVILEYPDCTGLLTLPGLPGTFFKSSCLHESPWSKRRCDHEELGLDPA